MVRVLVVVLMAVVLMSCTSIAPTPVSRIPFPESEYLSLPKTGTATITGQAFLKTRGGDVITAAGNEVLLNPFTSYSLQWYEKSYLLSSMLLPERHDPRLEKYFRRKVADASGRFTFKDVPAGEYFLVATVTWEAPVGPSGELVMQGGVIAKRI